MKPEQSIAKQEIENAFNLIKSLYDVKYDDIAPIYNSLYKIAENQMQLDYKNFIKLSDKVISND